MKRIAFFPVLCLCAVAFSSCKDRFNESGAEGRAISFSATAGFPSLLTKTQYSGEDTSQGDYERINWTAGDKIAILSPEAMLYDQSTTPWVPAPTSTNPPFSRAEYSISGTVTADGRYSSAGIVGTGSGGSLHWGSGEHRFYGVYPSSFVGFTTNLNGAAADITVSIPKDQRPASGVAPAVSTSGGVTGTHVYPDMRNAWMYSAQYAPESDKPVQLFFSPMVTAFQISVRGVDATEVPLTRFELVSQHCGLQGPFVARVQASGVVDRTHLDRMTVSYSGGLDNRVAGENDAVWFTLPEGTVVSSTKELTFTLFTYPRGTYAHPDYLDGLSLRCVSGGTTRELKLMDKDKNNWVQFPPGRKINIKGITLPEQVSPWTFSVTAEDWEEELSDVVVSPVQMTEFETEEGGTLDRSMVILVKDPADLVYEGGLSTGGKVQSYRSFDGGVTRTAIPWVVDAGVYATEADALAGSNPLGTSFISQAAPSGSSGGSSDPSGWEGLEIHYFPDASPQSVEDTGGKIDAALKAASPKNIQNGKYYNLANPDAPYTDNIKESANTYVVNGPGYYRFPLVVGNGVKNNAFNDVHYNSTDHGVYGDYKKTISSYWDYLGAVMSSGDPRLHKTSSGAGTPTTAFVVWEDVENLIDVKDTDFNLANTAITKTGSGNSEYYWVNFHISAQNIRQGNAVIAVADADGTTMWSWLIWVTDYVPGAAVTTNPSREETGPYSKKDTYLYFAHESISSSPHRWIAMPRNLGWVEKSSEKLFREASAWIRVRQDVAGGSVAAVRVCRPGSLIAERNSHQPFFQFGRKDAMIPFPVNGDQAVEVYGRYPSLDLDPNNGGKMSGLIQHPEKFKRGDRGMGRTEEASLWSVGLAFNSSDAYRRPYKTIYDPSPAGYTVPAWGAFNVLAKAPLVRDQYTGKYIFPAGVYGGCADGTPWNERRSDDYGVWFNTYSCTDYSGFADPSDYGTIYMPMSGYLNESGSLVNRQKEGRYWTTRGDESPAESLVYRHGGTCLYFYLSKGGPTPTPGISCHPAEVSSHINFAYPLRLMREGE